MKRRYILATVVGMSATIYVGLVLWNYRQKPVFFNRFGFHDKTMLPVPVWLPVRSEVQDATGNRFFADRRLNMFVIVQMPTVDRPPIVPQGAKSVELVLTTGRSISFEITRDSLTCVRPDGTVHTRQLSPCRAEQLFRAVESSTLSDRSSIAEIQ